MSTDARPQARTRFMANVFQLTEAKGMTMQDLAAAVGRHASGIAKWKAGMSEPKPGDIARLARSLGVTADQLLEGCGEETSPPEADD